jgi:hypothetical protein
MSNRSTRRPAAWWLAIPAAVALVASGVFAGRMGMRPAMAGSRPGEDPTAEDHSTASHVHRLEVLEQEVVRLRAEAAVARKGSHAEEAEAEAEGEGDSDDAALDDAPEDPEEADRALAEARAEFFTSLDRRLDAEPEDARWSGDTEPVIWRLLPQYLGTDVRVSSVSCGSTVCRAKVEHPGAPHLPEGRLADFLHQRGPLESMQVQLDVGETEATTLYFMR